MKETWDYNHGLSQTMVFPFNYKVVEWQNEPKGIKHILQERGLWPANDRRKDGMRFPLDCPTSDGRPGCGSDPELGDECCARTLIAAQRDFQLQKGWLQETLEASNQEVIFYLKFHCELNFIEHFWCAAKWYTRENCEYSLEGIRKTVPLAVHSISSASINRYFHRRMRVLKAYEDGLMYGTVEFKQTVYDSHRRIVDKTKW